MISADFRGMELRSRFKFIQSGVLTPLRSFDTHRRCQLFPSNSGKKCEGLAVYELHKAELARPGAWCYAVHIKRRIYDFHITDGGPPFLTSTERLISVNA